MCSLVVRFGLQRDALRYEVAAVGSGAERIKPRKVTGEIKLGCSSIRDSPGKEFCESRISWNPRSQVRIPLPGPRGAEENSKSHSLSPKPPPRHTQKSRACRGPRLKSWAEACDLQANR